MRALGSTFAGGSLKNRHMRTRPASYPLREINTMRAIVLLLLLACGLSACSPEGTPVAEAQYSAKIVGDWQGTVGDSKETISFNADGGFVSQVRRQGFNELQCSAMLRESPRMRMHGVARKGSRR